MGRQLTPDQWRHISDLFHKALAIPTSDRLKFIEAETREWPTLREELHSLLANLSSASSFLESPVVETIEASSKFPTGSRVGDFLLLRVLGAGSFATVYLAHQISLNRQVALKVSPNFGEEARTMAQLEHAHIVTVFSEMIEPERDLRLLCMQYVPGTTLERALIELPAENNPNGASLIEIVDRLHEGDARLLPYALRDRERLAQADFNEATLRIGSQIADALAFAHERNVLHLDVKPGNVLLTPYGRALLTDFNVSVSSQNDGTSHRVLGGTLKYMAPEHRRLFDRHQNPGDAGPIDARADIYSLGLVLKEMLERARNLVLDVFFVKILERCTEPEPDRRFSSAAELRDRLDGCLELRQITKRLPPMGPLTRDLAPYSLMLFIALSLVPQFLGSAVNIGYNAIMIVRHLTTAQQALFNRFVLVYNGVLYPICIYLFLQLVSPLRRCFPGISGPCDAPAEEIDELRAHVLSLPVRIAGIITLGWMPGSVLFPTVIHIFEGPVSQSVFNHFFISFTLSWLIALSYSCLYMQYVALRLLYPRLWWGKTGIRRIASRELAEWGSQLRLFRFMAAFIPLLGAVLVVLVGPADLSTSDYRIFQFLVTGLLVIGMIGLVFAFKASRILSCCLAIFTGDESYAESA